MFNIAPENRPELLNHQLLSNALPTVLKYDRLVYYGPRDLSRERLVGQVASGSIALLIATDGID